MKVQIQGGLYIESRERHRSCNGIEEIKGRLYMEPDHYEYVLKEYTGRFSQPVEQGAKLREVYKLHGYFPTVEAAALKVLTMRVNKSTAENLSQLIQDVERIRQELSKAMAV